MDLYILRCTKNYLAIFGKHLSNTKFVAAVMQILMDENLYLIIFQYKLVMINFWYTLLNGWCCFILSKNFRIDRFLFLLNGIAQNFIYKALPTIIRNIYILCAYITYLRGAAMIFFFFLQFL